MFAQFAKRAAVHAVARGTYHGNVSILLGLALAASLAGCLPTAPSLVGADPADPSAKVARTTYRSTIAPYTSLRPTTPSSWREQNDRVAPAPKPDR